MTSRATARSGSALLGPAIVGLAGVGALALLRWRDPHESGSYGRCPSLTITGLPCPGCGGLRAVNDLAHGDVWGAVGSNLLAVLLVFGGAIALVAWTIRRWRTGRGAFVTLTPAAVYATLAVIVVFGVVRLLPFGAALAP